MKALRLAPALLATFLSAAPRPSSAQSAVVFDRYSASIYKVEILERRSSTPSVVGTAFAVDTAGTVLTNYHVVKNVVFRPGDYRIRLVGNDGATVDSVRVLRVDAAQDLAALGGPVPATAPLRFAEAVPEVGTPVYSLGFPLNLTGTVVEGSFSGPMPNSLQGTFHFTGSLNPGMSGGPTLLADGEVVGVNVATHGNQLSYLVPASRARALLAAPREGEPDLLGDVRASLATVQERIGKVVASGGMEETEIGGFELPKPSDDVFDCSADPIDTDDIAYEGVIYRCGLDDRFWLDPDAWSSALEVEHVVLSTDELAPARFNSVVGEWYATVFDGEIEGSDWATDYRCEAGNLLGKEHLKLRTVQCWRRRPDLEGLYDLFARTTILGAGHDNVVSTYRMNGTTRANGLALLRQVLELTGRVR